MTDEADLLAAIRAFPDEDTPRLVYADYLQEHGEEERAEFIRVQVELAYCEYQGTDRSRELVARQSELSHSFSAAWFGHLLRLFGHPADLVKKRGFVDEVSCHAADWLAHGDAVLVAQPVRRVVLNRLGRDERIAVFERWAVRFQTQPTGMLFSECFRALWGCEVRFGGQCEGGDFPEAYFAGMRAAAEREQAVMDAFLAAPFDTTAG